MPELSASSIPYSNSIYSFPEKLRHALGEIDNRYHPAALPDMYPHVIATLGQLWPGHEATKYLDELMMPDRRGRRGFALEALREILFFKQLHEAIYPATVSWPIEPRYLNNLVSSARIPAEDVAPLQSQKISEREIGWAEITDIGELIAHHRSRRKGPSAPRRLVGEILVSNGVLSEEALRSSLHVQSNLTTRPRLGHILTSAGLVTPADMRKSLALQGGYPIVDLAKIDIDSEVSQILQDQLVSWIKAVPVAVVDGELIVAVENPLAYTNIRHLEFNVGIPVSMVCARRDAIAEFGGRTDD